MTSHPTAHVPIPELLHGAEGHVSSAQFGDVYFSRASGIAETRHVFLEGNGLPARFANRLHFTIGELGFGTGLNFKVAWEAFRAANPQGQLHYISVEKYPLSHAQLAALHPDLAAWYPLRLPGWHRVHLPQCTLTLGFGDAAELLATARFAADAWFLDGFAPAKNPEMWSDALFAELARLSAPDATLATFTAAGGVKRGLMAHGFAMRKVPGFGTKRDMLVGRRTGAPLPMTEAGTALVIGAGIAGVTAARALAERGVTVTVLEQGAVASGASGNPAAVLYPQLTKYYTPATAWHLTGYSYMLRQLARWRAEGLAFRWEQPGMLRIPREPGPSPLATLGLDPAMVHDLTAEEAAAWAGRRVAGAGMLVPGGSWINPGELCAALLQHPRITVHTHTPVTTLLRRDGQWHAGAHHADRAVIATAQHAAALLQDRALPLGASAGQVSMVKADGPLRGIVSHRGYVIPVDGMHLIGATYDRADLSGAVTAANHAENLGHARTALPGWQGSAPLAGRTSIRATTPDRLPYVGAVGEGVYISAGHGSRGMISAPLAAEVIAAQAMGEMVPLDATLQAAINPQRRAPSLP